MEVGTLIAAITMIAMTMMVSALIRTGELQSYEPEETKKATVALTVENLKTKNQVISVGTVIPTENENASSTEA